MQPAPQEIRTYFITTVTASRRRLFQTHQNSELLIDTLQDQRAKKRIALHAFVVMPDHVHLIWTPASDIALEKAMQYIKGSFSFQLKNKSEVWQRSYDNRRILDAEDFAERVRYIHQNPVRALIVTQSNDYAFSSAGRQNLVDPPPSHLG